MAPSSWKSAFSAGILPLLLWMLWAFLLISRELSNEYDPDTHLGVADLLTRFRTIYALAYVLDVRLALDKRDWKSIVMKPLLALAYAYGPVQKASSYLDSSIFELDLVLEFFSAGNAWLSWSTFLFTCCHASWQLSVTFSALADPTPAVHPAVAGTMQHAGVQTTPEAQPAPAVHMQDAAIQTAPEADRCERCSEFEERWLAVKSQRDDLSTELRDARVAHKQEARQLREDLHNSEAENETLKRERLQLTRQVANLQKESWKLTKEVKGLAADNAQLTSQKPREVPSRQTGWRASQASSRTSVRVNTGRTSAPKTSATEVPRAAVANAANGPLFALPGAAPAVDPPASSTALPTAVGTLPAPAAQAPVAPLPPQLGSHPAAVVSQQTADPQSALGSSQAAGDAAPARRIARPRGLAFIPEETKAKEQLDALGDLLLLYSGNVYVPLEEYVTSFGRIILYFTGLKQKIAAKFLETPAGQQFLQANVTSELVQYLPGYKDIVSSLVFGNEAPGKGEWDWRTSQDAMEQKIKLWMALEDILTALRRARGEEVDIPDDPFGLGDLPLEQDDQESEESEAE